MFKRLVALSLCLLLILSVAACKKATPSSTSSGLPAVITPEKPKTYINNLTGVDEFTDQSKTTQRPVAVMVNNVVTAQGVQTGVNKADIVYETEVEGGITRLLAVFKDIDAVEKIGTVRSARYPYVDLAMGHDAVYVHHGQDPTYCAPHLKDVDRIVVDTAGTYGQRIKNGLATEHTLYAFGDRLWAGVTKKFTSTSSSENWANFADKDESLTLSGGVCNTLTVPFSNSVRSVFKYDSTKGTYTRYFKDTLRTDYITGETTDVKNVFVLLTNITYYPDGYHRKIDLSSGSGYYISNGTYTQINWQKGAAKNSFKFTNLDGSELKVNAGNSWVNISDKNRSTPIISE